MISQTSVPLAVSSAWSQALLDVTAPTGTVAMRVWVYAEGQQLVLADALRLQEADCGQASNNTCNRLGNAGFELGIAGWDPDDASLLAGGGRNGGAAAQVGPSAPGGAASIGQPVSVTPGASLTLTAWYTARGAGWAGMGLHYLDASGVMQSQVGITLEDRSSFGQASLTVTPPAGTVAVRAWVYTESARLVVVDDLDLRVTGCGAGSP